MKKSLVLFSGLLFLLAIGSCTLPQAPLGTAIPDATGVYATVAAGLTATNPAVSISTAVPVSPSPVITDIAKPSPQPTRSPTAAGLDTPPAQVTASRTPIPCDLAAPGRPSVDISVPDGTRLLPGQTFAKTWRLVNAGSCPWTKEYAIIWFSGEMFGAVREQAMSGTVAPGQSIDITVDMVAPRPAGPHQSNWKLRNSRGTLFGIGPTGDAPFWVRIEVEEVATHTATNQPSSTLTPTPGTLSKGAIELAVGKTADLDTGKMGVGTGDDLSLQKTDGATISLVTLNGAVLADMGTFVPNAAECLSTNLQASSLPLATLKVGGTWCYRTSQGLPGFLRLTVVSAVESKISFDYQTWAIP